MKKYSLLAVFFISCNLFALPCPNGRGILYKGDSIAEVIKQCGAPQSQRKTTTVLSEVRQFIYYRNHAYDPGYTQLVVTTTNDTVSQIRIYERFVYYQCSVTAIPGAGGLVTTQTNCGNYDYLTQGTNVCGAGFALGAHINYVKSICGSPAQESLLSKNASEVAELTYRGTNNQLQTIVFTNGRLSEWK